MPCLPILFPNCLKMLLLILHQNDYRLMILPIVRHPTPTLWQTSRRVDDPTSKKIRDLIRDMHATMIHAEGIGIAAPQVGQNLRLFLVRTDEGYSEFINPLIRRR